jgi:hypothetical protein
MVQQWANLVVPQRPSGPHDAAASRPRGAAVGGPRGAAVSGPRSSERADLMVQPAASRPRGA